jgi:hypothetical protein
MANASTMVAAGKRCDFQWSGVVGSPAFRLEITAIFDRACRLLEGLLAGCVLGLKPSHRLAVTLHHRSHGLGTEVRSQQFMHQFAGRRERSLRRQPTTMLLHRLGVTLACDAQQLVDRIGPVRTTQALPIATREEDLADRAHQPPFFRPSVLLLASAGAHPQRRPFFSAASMRRATASASICA